MPVETLGRDVIASAIRDQGARALPMVDLYPDGSDQFIADPEWIMRADRESWVVISKDKSIWHDHSDILEETTLRMFVFTNANVTGSEMAGRLRTNWEGVLRRVAQAGPYVYAILPERLEKRWPGGKGSG